MIITCFNFNSDSHIQLVLKARQCWCRDLLLTLLSSLQGRDSWYVYLSFIFEFFTEIVWHLRVLNISLFISRSFSRQLSPRISRLLGSWRSFPASCWTFWLSLSVAGGELKATSDTDHHSAVVCTLSWLCHYASFRGLTRKFWHNLESLAIKRERWQGCKN